MKRREKFIVFMLLASLPMMAIFSHIRLSILRNDVQINEYKQKEYFDGLSRWYNDSYPGKSVLNGPEIMMDDPRVISRIRNNFLISPSPPNFPYIFSNPILHDTSMGQADKILSILGQQREGFFVECGALDGETRSNTLRFERHLNWSGLLIEADPLNFEKMITKNRKAYLSPTCLSVQPYPILVSFYQASNVGKISSNPPGFKKPGYVDVQCFPLYSYLLALNRTRIDYFSLDVEGNEFQVLKTIPFDKVDIRTLSVEFAHVKEGKEALRKFVEEQGYTLHSKVVRDDYLANDFIFVKTSEIIYSTLP